jgi:hypothetical protein
MPVPEGELTTAEIWSDPNGVNDQTVEENATSKRSSRRSLWKLKFATRSRS